MHAFKEGDLRSSDGQTMHNPRQAIAIAPSESGSSGQVSPERNRHARAHILDDETRQMLLDRATGQPARIPTASDDGRVIVRCSWCKAALREAITRSR